MTVINKVHIHPLNFSFEGYTVNAQIYTSVDGGKTFYYCGNGKYFKTLEEALLFKAEVEEVEK